MKKKIERKREFTQQKEKKKKKTKSKRMYVGWRERERWRQGTWSPVFVGWVYEGIRLKCEATLAATIKFIVIISHILDIYLVL